MIRNEPRKRWLASASVDNSGSVSTGRNQFSASLGVDNLFGLNDYLNLRHSEVDPRSAGVSDSTGVYWNVPYGYWNISTGINTYRYESQVQGQVSTFKTDGISNSQMLRADRVVYRDQSSKWSIGGGLTLKQIRNEIADLPIEVSSANLTVFDLGVNASVVAFGAMLSANAGVATGANAMGATADDASRPAGAPRAQFVKYTYGGSLYRSFSVGGQSLTWQTLVSGQYSQDPLYGAEQTAIGSLYTVRGFRTTSLAGRSGLYARNELGMPLPAPRWFGLDSLKQIKPYVGYDLGHISKTGTLEGWSAGLDLAFSNATLQIAYAHPVDAPDYLPKEHGWVYARLALSY